METVETSNTMKDGLLAGWVYLRLRMGLAQPLAQSVDFFRKRLPLFVRTRSPRRLHRDRMVETLSFLYDLVLRDLDRDRDRDRERLRDLRAFLDLDRERLRLDRDRDRERLRDRDLRDLRPHDLVFLLYIFLALAVILRSVFLPVNRPLDAFFTHFCQAVSAMVVNRTLHGIHTFFVSSILHPIDGLVEGADDAVGHLRSLPCQQRPHRPPCPYGLGHNGRASQSLSVQTLVFGAKVALLLKLAPCSVGVVAQIKDDPQVALGLALQQQRKVAKVRIDLCLLRRFIKSKQHNQWVLTVVNVTKPLCFLFRIFHRVI